MDRDCLDAMILPSPSHQFGRAHTELLPAGRTLENLHEVLTLVALVRVALRSFLGQQKISDVKDFCASGWRWMKPTSEFDDRTHSRYWQDARTRASDLLTCRES